MPTRATTTLTCGDGYPSGELGTASPAGELRPRSDWGVTVGPSNGPCPGSPAAAVSTAATSAKPSTSSPSQASPAPSSATGGSPADVGPQQIHRQVMTVV